MTGFPKQLLRILPAAGFSVLSGLCGVGLTWIVVAMVARRCSHSMAEKLFDESMLLLTVGGIVSFLIGLIVSVMVLRMDPAKEAQIEERYVGPDGRLKIYFGVPTLIIVLLVPLFERIRHFVGQNADIYVDLGIGLVVLALSLILREHIPRRFIIPLGVIAWLLTLSLAVWYYFFGPGAFGHATM